MIIISNISAIFRKELQSYFISPLAYIVTAVFWFLLGSLFVDILQRTIESIATYESLGVSLPPIDVPYEFMGQFFAVLGLLVLYILPILSMGLYAEERKRGTLELLATSPITNWIVATGKLLGAIAFFSIAISPMIIYEVIVFSAATPTAVPLQVPLLAHVGLLLLAGAVLSLGMFISSLTDSSILAAILTFALVLFLWLIDLLADKLNGTIGEVLSHLSLLKHYNNLVQGILDPSSLVLFASYILLGLFLTAQSIEIIRFSSR
ncbi:MAG: ABC transporter permease subunit [Prochloron sp. SP5CPC1]|nr:ABC transporter permease subunit [Candidatus Paraprochloron terpiosi SP5CPC1]